jgi:hypothetical protein
MSGSNFSRSIDVFIRQNLSPEARSAALAEVARRGVAELIATGQASPRYRRIVDGVEGAPETAVRPDGVIVYRFDAMAEIVAFALAFLAGRSPVRSGAFRRGFYVGLDGRFVMASAFNAATMGRVSEVVIGNVEPYARMVDVQMAGGQPVRFSVPADMFSDAAGAVRARFGNIITARREYNMTFPGQYLLRAGKRAGKRVQSPALVISVR